MVRIFFTCLGNILRSIPIGLNVYESKCKKSAEKS